LTTGLRDNSFARLHSPYVPPRQYFDRYAQGELPEPHIGEWAQVHDDPETAADPNAWRGRMTSAQIGRARAGYYGEISFIDAQVGRAMSWMQQHVRRQLADTWILFAWDHGDMQGDHNLWRKTYAYEGSARVPFILVPPRRRGKPDRAVVDEIVELRDVMPTLLEAAGLPVPHTVDGSSLIPLLTRRADSWRKYIHGEHCRCYSGEQEMQYITDGARKFIWLPRTGQEQFFNLEEDPGETCNRIEDPNCAEEVQQWRSYLVRELKERNCGWVMDGKLDPGDDPLVSPFKDVRWLGARPAQEE